MTRHGSQFNGGAAFRRGWGRGAERELDHDPWVSFAAACRALGMTDKGAAQRVRRGSFPVPLLRDGRRLIVHEDDLTAHLAGLAPDERSEGYFPKVVRTAKGWGAPPVYVRPRWMKGGLTRFEDGCKLIGIDPVKAEALVRANRFGYPVHTGASGMRVFGTAELLAAIKARETINDVIGNLLAKSPTACAPHEPSVTPSTYRWFT